MIEDTPPRPTLTRQTRRRMHTRGRLIAAACAFLADGIGSGASVQQLAHRADVGVGTFYNHFASKEALFDAAVAETLADFGTFFDEACVGVTDPVTLFAHGVRMTVHLHHSHRVMTDIVMRLGFEYLATDTVLTPRAADGLRAAAESAQLHIDHLDTALACTAGSLLGCLHLLAADSTLDVAHTATTLAEGLLKMFGLDDAAAKDAASRPLARSSRQFGAPPPALGSDPLGTTRGATPLG